MARPWKFCWKISPSLERPFKKGTIDGLPRLISVATPVALQSGNWRTVLVRTTGKITAVSQPKIGPAAEKRRGFLFGRLRQGLCQV